MHAFSKYRRLCIRVAGMQEVSPVAAVLAPGTYNPPRFATPAAECFCCGRLLSRTRRRRRTAPTTGPDCAPLLTPAAAVAGADFPARRGGAAGAVLRAA